MADVASMSLQDRHLIFTDTETTGLDPARHEIIEIAALVVRPPLSPAGAGPGRDGGDGDNFVVVDSWSAKVMPEHLETADPESLPIAGWEPEAWRGAISQAEAIREYAERARGGILVAYNVTFDWTFLEATARRCGVALALDYHRLDALSMAYLALFRHPNFSGLSLSKVASLLNVSLDRSLRHSALEDARAMYEIFRKIVQAGVTRWV